jgi:superfamily II DNA/RNA helicase
VISHLSQHPIEPIKRPEQGVLYRRVTPPVPSSFASILGFEVTKPYETAFAKDGITVPTKIQLEAIPPILEGRNVVVESGTGTGKTLAYLLPVLQILRNSLTHRAVCFAPANELAVQTMRVAERYKDPALKTITLISTANPKKDSRLEKSTRLITGTPSKILEAYEKRKLKGVNLVILDEPEPILCSRDADYLIEVLSRPEPKLQLIVVGATFGRNTRAFIDDVMGPETIHIKATDDPLRQRIFHQSVAVRNEGEKDFVLSRFIGKLNGQRVIVFVNHPKLIRHLYRYLNEQGIKVNTVSHDRTKLQCAEAVRDFSKNKTQVLLITDQAATGLDIPDVDWVLHFELPSSAEAYVHRAGRTGRAGKSGSSVVFITQSERISLRKLEQSLLVEFKTR